MKATDQFPPQTLLIAGLPVAEVISRGSTEPPKQREVADSELLRQLHRNATPRGRDQPPA